MPMSSAVRRRPADRGPAPGHDRDTGVSVEMRARQSVGYLARYAYRAFAKALASELAPHGIPSGHWSVLRVLWEEEGMSQVELADRMRVEKASLTGVLDAMERRALILRTRNAEDRRKVNITLSPQGHALKQRLLPFGLKINRKATRGMSAKEVDELRRSLARLIENLES
jgi:MarR family transcriptional regulator, organic hydroperoxide resistance regulator